MNLNDWMKYLFVFLAYGKVFLVRKNTGHDVGQLYAMKVRSYVHFHNINHKLFFFIMVLHSNVIVNYDFTISQM